MHTVLPDAESLTYKKVFELSPEAIVIINKTGHITDINERVQDWLGYKKSELIGKHLLALPFLPLMSKEQIIKNFLKRMAGREVGNYTVEFKTKNKEIRMGSIRANLLRDEHDKVIGEIVMVSEITQEYAKQTLVARREKILEAVGYSAKHFLKTDNEHKNFDNVLKKIGEATDSSRVLLFMNNMTYQSMEWHQDDVKPIEKLASFPNIFFKDTIFSSWTKALQDREVIYGHSKDQTEKMKKNLEDQQVQSFLVLPIYVKGVWWAYLHLQQCDHEREWEKEEVDSLMIAADIIGAAIEKNNLVLELRETSAFWKREKEKVAEEASNTERFKLAVDAATDGMLIATSDLEIIYSNSAWMKMTGYSFEEIEGQKLSTIVSQSESSKKNIWGTLKEKKSINTDQLLATKMDGIYFPIRLSLFPIIDKKNVVFYVALIEDITKRKEVEQMKSDFISIASHQLNTPLSAMKWFLELLLNGKAGVLTEKQLEFIQNISDSNMRMLALVRSLLNISRIESGRIIVEPRKLELKEVIESVLVDLQPQIKRRKQKVHVDVKDLPKISLDQKLIRQVYLNLISNALKYSDDGDVIELDVYAQGDDVISHVKDRGIGIPIDEQKNIFNRFFRGSNVMKLDTDGTGLGLYLVKIIVESSGGKVWYKSSEGKGSEFWFSLPIKGMKPKEGEVQLDGSANPL